MKLLTIIAELYHDSELLKADGFDSAVIGLDEPSMRLIYSVKKCIKILQKQGMDYEEAHEYFDFNVRGSYVGEHTPIWCDDDF